MKPYWQQRQEMKLKGTSKLDKVRERKEEKSELDKWYDVQRATAPKCCENCGAPLAATINFHSRGHICHIVPKKNFKSVRVHPLNRWFGCSNCHTKYDARWDNAVKMKIWPTVVERFKKFMQYIADKEIRFLPQSLRKIYDDAKQISTDKEIPV